MTRLLSALSLAAVMLVPSWATAQESGDAAATAASAASGGESDRTGPGEWREVERGLYASGTFGVGLLLGAPGDGAPSLLSGLSLGVAFGYDVIDQLQLEGFIAGAQISASPGYSGLSTGETPSGGDFSTVVAGAKARFAYLSFDDNQSIDRLFLTAHAGAGVFTTAPASVAGGMRAAVLAGAGLRYYTRMRHFSVILEVDAIFGLGVSSLVIYPQAGVAYTF